MCWQVPIGTHTFLHKENVLQPSYRCIVSKHLKKTFLVRDEFDITIHVQRCLHLPPLAHGYNWSILAATSPKRHQWSMQPIMSLHACRVHLCLICGNASQKSAKSIVFFFLILFFEYIIKYVKIVWEEVISLWPHKPNSVFEALPLLIGCSTRSRVILTNCRRAYRYTGCLKYQDRLGKLVLNSWFFVIIRLLIYTNMVDFLKYMIKTHLDSLPVLCGCTQICPFKIT